MTKIKELENQLKQIQEELNKLKENEKEEGDWKPEDNENYFYVDKSTLEPEWSYYDMKNDYDEKIIKHNLIFKTEREALEYLEYLLAKEKAMNEFTQEEWEDDNICKHCFYYDYDLRQFIRFYYRTLRVSLINFRTDEEAQNYINKYKKFILKEMGIKQ